MKIKMEQYWMPKKIDFINLRLCLDNYECTHLFIRYIGSQGGNNKVNEVLNGRKLDFKKTKHKLEFLIDSKQVYEFNLEHYNKDNRGFSLAYDRKYPDGKIVMLSTGADPYDKSLPEPHESTLRHCLQTNRIDHLAEITFKGRVDLEFHSWWQKPHNKYWKVVHPKTA
jgi:hypothetical protein